MIQIERTDSTNRDFIELVQYLDLDLARRNGESNDFFVAYNNIQYIQHVALAIVDGKAITCGAFKQYDENTLELKRMYCREEYRGKGFAVKVLNALEQWAKELGYRRLILETGEKMPEAIGLYKKCGYSIIPNFGPYENVASSICFEKIIGAYERNICI